MAEQFPSGGYPSGWYAICPSSRLGPGQVELVHYFGRDRVLYRTQGGTACLADPICPHMGANLSMGRVVGENLVCGMHGFEFGCDGRCVKLAYGTRPPPKARLTMHPIDEADGFVFFFYSPDAAAPMWKIEPLDWAGWTPLRHQRLEFVGHPQDTTENSVDIGHFKTVHHYSASVEADPVVDSEKLRASYSVVRPWFGPRLPKLTFSVEFDVLAHGLGYSLIEVEVRRTPIRIRYFVNATPIDGKRIHLNIAASIRKLAVPGLNSIVREAVLYGLRHDVSQDIPLWQGKHYLERPLLAEGDGPIAIYRRWCKQFYPATGESSRLPAFEPGSPTRSASAEVARPSHTLA
jgi:nitrite reductase/ring-hydroxylating ferredoxin subunit